MFITKLESLRGIAALVVAISHSLIVFSVDHNQTIWLSRFYETDGLQSLVTSLLLIPFNGGAAVTIFFVLSGYVLGLSLDKRPLKIAGVFSFYIRRIFRIYPAYIVSLLIIISSIYFFHTYIEFPNTSTWFNWWFTSEISLPNAAKNISMLEINLNPIAWTLRVELVMSFFFPFAYVLSRKIGEKSNLVILALLVALSFNYSSNIYFRFGFVFYLGLLLPIIIEKLDTYASKRKYNIILAVSIIFLLFSRILFLKSNIFYAILLEGIFSSLIIAIIADTKTTVFLSRILDLDITRKLGRLSFSFYIYHFIVLYWLSYCLLLIVSPEVTGRYPLPLGILLAIVSVSICYYVSIISYQWVEQPMIKCGAITAENLTHFISNLSVPISLDMRLNRYKRYLHKRRLAVSLLFKNKYWS
ncbi:acyltransferase [uncultured Gimesia sp.]|mgnify:CR=1 FL=1|uniref:acyltransferase family protein n=1 Tax=uncultured Gimesia sp. TaxID=1678688 RepID=UPI0030D7EB9A|tara:strand:- start:68286 stop:69527 length:1242 start_codon:yes stop_codon:yes gene_type:complete